jgi:hypothetical protein
MTSRLTAHATLFAVVAAALLAVIVSSPVQAGTLAAPATEAKLTPMLRCERSGFTVQRQLRVWAAALT